MGKLKDNRAALVTTAVAARLAPARIFADGPGIDREGRCFLLPGAGGINLGVHAGDRVDSWAGDHLMPGLSLEEEGGDPAAVGGAHLLSCIGNRVRDAEGRGVGIVVGKRGGLGPNVFPPSYVAVEVPDAVAASAVPGQRLVVEAVGRGLALTERPEIGLFNLSPAALDLLPLAPTENGVAIAVKLIVPSRLAVSGLGTDAWVGDLEFVEDAAIRGAREDLRFGDLVAFTDIDARFGRFYRPGRVAVGLVAHGASPAPGHGVGVTILLSGPAEQLRLTLDPAAGIGHELRKLVPG